MPFFYFQLIQSRSDEFRRETNTFAINMTNIFNQTKEENFKLWSLKILTLWEVDKCTVKIFDKYIYKSSACFKIKTAKSD